MRLYYVNFDKIRFQTKKISNKKKFDKKLTSKKDCLRYTFILINLTKKGIDFIFVKISYKSRAKYILNYDEVIKEINNDE